MKKIFVIFGVVIFFAVSVFAIVQIYKRYKSAQYEETAVPYVKMVVPEISKWDPEIIKKYMPAESLEGTTEERMIKIVDYLSRLGELKNMEEPRFSSVTVRTIPGGEKTVVTYTVDAEYKIGDAVMTIGLLDKEGSFTVHNFHINSEALAE